MSSKKGESFSTASGADQERTETYKSDIAETTSKTKLGDDVFSYTRVSRISQGFFDNDDLALRHYDEAKDTFTALEAAYKRLLLQVEATKEERRYEVSFTMVTSKTSFRKLVSTADDTLSLSESTCYICF